MYDSLFGDFDVVHRNVDLLVTLSRVLQGLMVKEGTTSVDYHTHTHATQ